MVGQAILRELRLRGTPTAGQIYAPSRSVVNLERQGSLEHYLEASSENHWTPTAVYICAGHVGGVVGNMRNQAEFLTRNAQIALNSLEALKNAPRQWCIDRVFYFSSSCVYPPTAGKPFKPESMGAGRFEETNRGYALAKTVGTDLARNLRNQKLLPAVTLVPCNLYGPGDRYQGDASHVIPGLIQRMTIHNLTEPEKPFMAWGHSEVQREFLYVRDLAAAVVDLLDVEMDTLPDIINIGSGAEMKMGDLVTRVQEVVGYMGEVSWDNDQPTGVWSKLMDSSTIRALTGWKPTTHFHYGIARTYEDFMERYGHSLTVAYHK